jgi:misacylated tRNA(Ala) deacylase
MMFCHAYPDILEIQAEVLDARPGAVLLSRHPFFPGGGGQLPDRGILRWRLGETAVTGFFEEDGNLWIQLADSIEIAGSVEVAADARLRQVMRELHTDLHILNALVFQQFDGALVTGAQMNDDGTARIDFDLTATDNDKLRALEPALNDVLVQDLTVSDSRIPMIDAQQEKGLLRSRSVAPPPSPDGMVRIVEIRGLDRQACGGTHLASTGGSRPVRILKIDNKGRHNRRLRIALEGV